MTGALDGMHLQVVASCIDLAGACDLTRAMPEAISKEPAVIGELRALAHDQDPIRAMLELGATFDYSGRQLEACLTWASAAFERVWPGAHVLGEPLEGHWNFAARRPTLGLVLALTAPRQVDLPRQTTLSVLELGIIAKTRAIAAPFIHEERIAGVFGGTFGELLRDLCDEHEVSFRSRHCTSAQFEVLAERVRRWPDRQRVMPVQWSISSSKDWRPLDALVRVSQISPEPRDVTVLDPLPHPEDQRGLCVLSASLDDIAGALDRVPGVSSLKYFYSDNAATPRRGIERLQAAGYFDHLAELSLLTEFETPHALDVLDAPCLHTMKIEALDEPEDAAIARFLLSGRSPGLRVLDLSDNDLGGETLGAIAETPYLQHLEVLDLSGVSSWTLPQLFGLMRARGLINLRELDLSDTRVDAAALEALGESVFAETLERLSLADLWLELTVEGCQALGSASALSGLRCLDVSDNKLDDECVRALLAGHGFTSLEKLRLSDYRLSEVSLQHIIEAPALRSLRELGVFEIDRVDLFDLAPATNAAPELHTLGLSGLRDGALARLLRGVDAVDLMSLTLIDGALSVDDLRALLDTRWFRDLVALELRGCQLQDTDLERLGEVGLASCVRLCLADNHLTSGSLGELSRATARLEELDLSGNPIGDEGLRLLATLPFERLRSLNVVRCGSSDRIAEILGRAPWFDGLRELYSDHASARR